MSERKRIIFLDFEGVMLTPGCPQVDGERRPAPEVVDALNYLLEATGADIVVTSDMRTKELGKMRDLLNGWGVRGRVLGTTPRPELLEELGEAVPSTRGGFIRLWLDKYERLRAPIAGYVIIDDAADFDGAQAARLIRCDRETGLTRDLADRARIFLQHGLQPKPPRP